MTPLLRLEPRAEASRAWVYLTPVLAVGLTLVAGGILFAAMGFDPFGSLHAIFVAPITTVYGLSEWIVKATPLTLIAVGLAMGFRANVWNIGAEGQLTLGAICGGGLALAFWGEESWWLLPAMIVTGALGGMAWAAIPAFLKTKFNANEILTSLMLTYVATLLLATFVYGPWRDPDGFNFPQSRLFGYDATLPVLVAGTRMHLGALFALAAVIGGWILISRSFIGFQIKVIGLTPQAAGYAGFSQKRIVWFTLLLGGGLAGMAGLFEVAGPIGQLIPSISPGYGFTAIIVAFLGRLHPAGILAAALLMALTYVGGESVQITMGLPLAATSVFQGMLLFFLLACDVLIRFRIRVGRPTVAGAAPAAVPASDEAGA